MNAKRTDAFRTLQLIRGPVMVEMDWAGEYNLGPEQQYGPGGVPLFAFVICSCPCADTVSPYWEPIPDTCQGTRIPLDTPRAVLEKVAQKIMERVYEAFPAGNSIVEICQGFSGIRNEGCPRCGSENGYTGSFIEYHTARFDSKGNWVADLGCQDSRPGSGPFTCGECGAAFAELPVK